MKTIRLERIETENKIRRWYGIEERSDNDPYFHPALETSRARRLPENIGKTPAELKVVLDDKFAENKTIIANYFYLNADKIKEEYRKNNISKTEGDIALQKEKEVVAFYHALFNRNRRDKAM